MQYPAEYGGMRKSQQVGKSQKTVLTRFILISLCLCPSPHSESLSIIQSKEKKRRYNCTPKHAQHSAPSNPYNSFLGCAKAPSKTQNKQNSGQSARSVLVLSSCQNIRGGSLQQRGRVYPLFGPSPSQCFSSKILLLSTHDLFRLRHNVLLPMVWSMPCTCDPVPVILCRFGVYPCELCRTRTYRTRTRSDHRCVQDLYRR
jgi:hypothetical protein